MHNPKLHIPEPALLLFARDRRMKLLSGEAHRPLIAVTAPTGYGKTTLLASRADELAAIGAPVGWLTLDAEDNDAGRLLASIISMLPFIDEEEKERLQAELALEPVLHVLNAAGETYLFFDRYETLRSGDAHRLFERLITESGGHIRCCIASREKLPFASGVRHLRPLTITQEQLRLDPNEMRSFLRKRTRTQSGPSALARLEQSTEGWPLALDVFAAMLGASGASPWNGEVDADELAFRLRDVFLDDVWSKLPERLQHFMLRTSIPESFDAELARFLTEGDDLTAIWNGWTGSSCS